MTRQTLHIRLPQRADAVEGKEQQPGKAVPPEAVPDSRAVSQDPAQKPSKVQKAEAPLWRNWIKGPWGPSAIG